MNQGNATVVIVVLLLVIVIRAALESAFGHISEHGWSSVSSLLWGQIGVFFILTLRFHLGALHFGSIEPKKLDFHIKSLNFVFAFLLFCSFYSVAYFVVTIKYFYILVVVLHSIDAAWFLIALICSLTVDDSILDKGEVRISAYQRIMAIFFTLSIITICYAMISYKFFFKQSMLSGEEISAHYWFLGVLVILTVIDFVILHKYYFKHDVWISDNAKE